MTEADIDGENQTEITSFEKNDNTNNAASDADAQAPLRRSATQYLLKRSARRLKDGRKKNKKKRE